MGSMVYSAAVRLVGQRLPEIAEEVSMYVCMYIYIYGRLP